jgi:hypothetical protein
MPDHNPVLLQAFLSLHGDKGFEDGIDKGAGFAWRQLLNAVAYGDEPEPMTKRQQVLAGTGEPPHFILVDAMRGRGAAQLFYNII